MPHLRFGHENNDTPSAGCTVTVTFGYTILYVEDVAATMDFYRAAFGFAERLATPEGDYGELDTGATTLSFVSNGLADANLAGAGGFARLENTGQPPGISITLVTGDLQGTVDTAVAAGARVYVEPTEKPWGQTVAYIRDPNGVLVELATPISA